MIEATREQLPNGLRAIFVRMAGFHSAIATVYLRMGPRFETRETNGLSHFAEHVLFKGTRRLPEPEAVSREIDAIGAELNGATMPEYTELMVSCHSRHFLRGLELLAEVVLHPTFARDHVETERRVVIEEMSHYRDVAGEDVNLDELSYELMWPSQAHSFSCLGYERNLARFGEDELAAHYHRFLQAANMVVCVAGNYPQDEVVDLLSERFGSLERGHAATPAPLRDVQASARHAFRRAPTRMAHLKLCHKACSYHDPKFYRVLVASDILGGGVTSRLFSRLRERDGLVYDVCSNTTLFSDCGWVDIATTTRRERAADAVEGALEEVRRLADQGLDEATLQMFKDRVACQMEILEDSPPDVADWLGVREILLAPQRLVTPTEEAKRLKSITAEEIRAVAQEVFRPSRRSLVVVGPSSWAQRRRIRGLVAR
ncbi:MAG: M16 family metallopeptidase [Candidatus Brocadiia bacterium]